MTECLLVSQVIHHNRKVGFNLTMTEACTFSTSIWINHAWLERD